MARLAGTQLANIVAAQSAAQMATCAHKIRNVLLTLQQAGVSGMLIVGSQRLNKGDRWQVFGLQIQEEVVFIL